MSLKNLLMSATGEIGRGRLFNFLLSMADAFSSSGSGALYPQFAYGKGIAVQNNISTGTDLTFEGVGEVNGIGRSPGDPNDSWLLTAGKVYVLRAGGYFDTFSNPTGGSVRIQWCDDSGAALQSASVDCPNALFTPTTNTGAQSSAALVEIIYRAPASDTGRVVKVQCTAATGTASKPQSTWWASLVEIPVAA